MVAPALLSVGECAARLGISPAVVYDALRAGALVGCRFGRQGRRGVWRVEAYALEQWVQTLKVGRAAPPPAPARPPGGFRHLRL